METLGMSIIVVCLILLVSISVAAVSPSNSHACFGQASAVFAQMGEMGDHASGFPTPRLGLRNLARLFDAGVLPDDSMTAGGFVAK